jgi:hypothetical protein
MCLSGCLSVCQKEALSSSTEVLKPHPSQLLLLPTFIIHIIRLNLKPPPIFRTLDSLHPTQINAGDYAEYPDTCPFTTTCPTICVAQEQDCPTSCPEGTTLCEWGACMEDCSMETNEIENLCYCETLSFACAKVIDVYENCFIDWEDNYYTPSNECIAQQEESVPLVSFTGPYFLACYVILAVVTFLVIVWCAYNTHIPVRNAITTMKVPITDDDDHDTTTSNTTTTTTTTTTTNTTTATEDWILTGYQRHPVGIVIHGLVNFVLIGFQFLLFVLTIFYYMQQGAITRWEPIFHDEVQVLMAFEIVWMVGFVWCFAFCYPSSIRDLFLRKCDLSCATFVAVYAPLKEVTKSIGNNDNTTNKEWGGLIMGAFWMPFDLCLRCVFSYPYTKPGHETVFCPIAIDGGTGKRGFYFRLRRYVYGPMMMMTTTTTSSSILTAKGITSINTTKVYDADVYVAANDPDDDSDDKEPTMAFQQGKIIVGTTLGDFVTQSIGLTSEEAKYRFGSTGPNSVPVMKPSVWGCIVAEFSRPFYLYQNFMVWTWAPYWYYYMAISNTIVRVVGGIVVGIFQHSSDSVLYKLSHMEGTSMYVFIQLCGLDWIASDWIVAIPHACCSVARSPHPLIYFFCTFFLRYYPRPKTESYGMVKKLKFPMLLSSPAM